MKQNRSPNEPSQRQLRVGEQIKQILAETLREGHFSSAELLDMGSQVTVTEVRASPDLRNATAYIVLLGGIQENTDYANEVISALNEDARLFQKEINRQSNLKFTPRIRFKYDASFDEGSRIDTLLSQIRLSDQEHDQDEE